MIRTTEQFIEKARCVHGDKYDYSKVDYINSSTKVCIICPEHGEFWQNPKSHIRGCGCPKCQFKLNADRCRFTTKQFIDKAKEVHGEKYDYSKVEYINNSTKVCIICPEHGEFWQRPANHLDGQGCPKCSGKVIDNEIFINKAKKIHGDKYDYNLVNYRGNEKGVIIVCPIHGEFLQTPHDHLQGCGCPKCGNVISYEENNLFDFIKNDLKLNAKQSDRTILNGKELDIYIPDKKIAIEYDGLLWHSEKYGKDKDYHLNKTLECEKQGIRLIHIFEDEWLYKKDIVKSKLRHIFCGDVFLDKIYGRKCIIKEITFAESKEFLEKNHIQGFVTSTLYLGCFTKTNNELVGVMSFKKERNDNDNWELTRFATDINRHCIGVGGKLFSYFVKKYNPSYVKSFADRRWTLDKSDNLYIKLGFELDRVLGPDYRYVVRDERVHKFNFRIQILNKKYNLSLSMTEKEMCDKLGFYRIWDCGLFKYMFKNQ